MLYILDSECVSDLFHMLKRYGHLEFNYGRDFNDLTNSQLNEYIEKIKEKQMEFIEYLNDTCVCDCCDSFDIRYSLDLPDKCHHDIDFNFSFKDCEVNKNE